MIVQRTAFLSKLLGLFCVAYGIEMFLHRDAFLQEVTAAVHDPAVILIIGILTLAAGLAFVLAHNVWSGGPVPVVLTVIAWLTLFKGLVFVFLTPDAIVTYFAAIRYEQFYYVYSSVCLLLGAYLTYGGMTVEYER